MGLVDGDEGGSALGQHLGKARDAEALGSDEEEIEPARQVIDARLPRVGPRAARVDALGAKALGYELGRLVFHQRDERAHHQCRAGAGDAGELIAERFAGAGGHHQEEIAPLGGGATHGLLVGAKIVEAEGGLEQAAQVLRCCGGARPSVSRARRWSDRGRR